MTKQHKLLSISQIHSFPRLHYPEKRIGGNNMYLKCKPEPTTWFLPVWRITIRKPIRTDLTANRAPAAAPAHWTHLMYSDQTPTQLSAPNTPTQHWQSCCLLSTSQPHTEYHTYQSCPKEIPLSALQKRKNHAQQYQKKQPTVQHHPAHINNSRFPMPLTPRTAASIPTN